MDINATLLDHSVCSHCLFLKGFPESFHFDVRICSGTIISVIIEIILIIVLIGVPIVIIILCANSTSTCTTGRTSFAWHGGWWSWILFEVSQILLSLLHEGLWCYQLVIYSLCEG